MKRFRRSFVVFMVSGIWMALGVPVYSQTPNSQTDIYTLGEVVVTGKRDGVESIATVREITAQDIRNKNARTLDQAIELLPGLDIRTGTDGVPRVNLRGFRSRHVLLLIDGIPFNSTFDGQFDPSIIPVENIAKIKISYGNHSVLYGQGGLGGVINLITKKGKEGLHSTVSGEVGEEDHYLGRFTLSGGKENLDFFVSGSASDRDGYPLSDDFEATLQENGDLRENSDRESENLFANLGFDLNDNWKAGIIVNSLRGEFGKPPSTLEKSKDDPFTKNPKFVRLEDYKGLSTQASISSDLSGPLNVRGWGFIDQLDEDENRYDDNNYNSMNNSGSYDKDTRTRIQGGTLQTILDLENPGRFTLGLSAERQEFDSEGFIVGKKGGITKFDNESDVQIYTASIEYELYKVEPFGLVLGYNHSWFNKENSGNDNEGGFLIGAHYDILENTRIRGSFAGKFRFPSIRQLYEEDSGNPDLTPEKSYNYEIGIEQNLPGNSTIVLTGFVIDAKDYIEKIDSTDRFENNDEYRFRGFELTAENHYWKNLMVRAGYTFLDTEDRSSGTEKEELQYRPEHKFTVEAKYDFAFALSAYMNIMYVADQYYYSNSTPSTPLLKRKLNEYTLMNIKLNQALLKDRWHLYLGVDNLFDKDYEEAYAFPQAGRTVYGGVEFRLW
ncbi:MAG: TonB-dependent receptor [Deltaproteobacteria bacterium]|nr:TonB-dependent receptor [Deltaproteobacteria bacterium]